MKLHPELFLAPDSWNFHDTPCDLHLTPDGILLGDQKVADAAHIVERIARADLPASDSITRKTLSYGQKAAIITAVSGVAALVVLLNALSQLAK